MKKMKFQVLIERYPTKYTPLMKMFYWLILPVVAADVTIVILSSLNPIFNDWNDLLKLISGIYLLLYLITLVLDWNLREKAAPEYKYWNFF
ncbi:hypothetical protein [Xylocopilactobacillus apicola]|uniref:Uncharacterized protein n=1 Tax=Xylocopilactobacillus apicola TaxID=2932184 RepID=A0AAU9D9T8_9LACO|nr:hypothetical protein [Xylocopilactobacillus apicola]BDR59135.1 hypothetical protein XA3_15760 [Xylocopilactobacillus apicola]